MGKAIKWFRGLLGLKKSDNTSPATPNSGTKPPPKRRRSFIKSNTNHNRSPAFFKSPEENDGFDQEQEHAIVVAEFAVMAANRAAEVVWLTSGDLNVSNGNMNTAAYVNTSGFGSREVWAAVNIQSHFRAYLSRRALRALKGLVKLQALVRGHIVRRQETEKLMQMQAVSRARRRACALRAQMSESAQSTKFCHLNHPDPATPEKFEHVIRRGAKNEQSLLLKRNGSRSNFRVDPDKEKLNYHYSMDEGSWDRVYLAKSGLIDEGKSDKIMEIDTGKYHITPKRRNLIQSSLYPSAPDPNSHSFTTSKDSTLHQAIFSPSSGEVQSPSPLKYTDDVDKASFCTAETSPQFISSKGASFMRSEPFTPTRSDASRSCLSGYSDYYPNYMSYTESSKAKVRSLSAPRQRTQLDRSNTAKRFSIHSGYSEVITQRVPSALHSSFTNKAYPGSGRLNRLGMPMGGDGVGFSGGILNKY